MEISVACDIRCNLLLLKFYFYRLLCYGEMSFRTRPSEAND